MITSHLQRLTGVWMLVALAGCAVNRPELAADDAAAVPVEVLLYAESTRPDDQGRIVVPVMLNERGPFYFMLDTGATHTVITRQALEQLGLQADEQRPVLLRGVSSVKRVPTVVVSSLQAGSLRFNQVRMPVLSGLIVEGLDGILGIDSLGDNRVSADFQNDNIRITDANGIPADKGYSVVAFNRVSRPLIMINARVGRIPTRAIIDTGGAHTLGNIALLKALQRQSGGKLAGAHQSDVTDATDTTKQVLLAPVPNVEFGPVGVANLMVSFGEFSIFKIWGVNDRPTLLIGMDALGLLNGLTIDYRRKELHIAKAVGN
jgi:Aspartyl protease